MNNFEKLEKLLEVFRINQPELARVGNHVDYNGVHFYISANDLDSIPRLSYFQFGYKNIEITHARCEGDSQQINIYLYEGKTLLTQNDFDEFCEKILSLIEQKTIELDGIKYKLVKFSTEEITDRF